jgi:hypothetical protein
VGEPVQPSARSLSGQSDGMTVCIHLANGEGPGPPEEVRAAPHLRSGEQNQFRRPMTPINTPMAAAPANAPKGLRRAMLSSSVANVFA